jgi:hypothetical protein
MCCHSVRGISRPLSAMDELDSSDGAAPHCRLGVAHWRGLCMPQRSSVPSIVYGDPGLRGQLGLVAEPAASPASSRILERYFDVVCRTGWGGASAMKSL